MATAINMGSSVEFPKPIQNEEENQYLERVIVIISPEFTDITGRLGILTYNTKVMLETTERLRTLQAEGKISPQTFNENARIYNDTINSRGEYTGNLQARVKALTTGLGFGIDHLVKCKGKLEQAIAVGVSGEGINSALQNRLDEVKNSLVMLREKNAEAEKITAELPTLLKNEFNSTKAVEAKLNNGGASVRRITKAVGYLASYVFNPSNPKPVALQQVVVEKQEESTPILQVVDTLVVESNNGKEPTQRPKGSQSKRPRSYADALENYLTKSTQGGFKQ